MRPSPEVVQGIGYWLAQCLAGTRIQLHAFVFMSNHYHLDITDPHGEIVEFKNRLNAVLARYLNTVLGRSDSIWSGDGPCDVQILSDHDMLQSMAYTLANPNQAGLVKWGHRWPGLISYGMAFGETREFGAPWPSSIRATTASPIRTRWS